MKNIEQTVSSAEDRYWCVYIHTNKVNNKAYIGITSQDPELRWGSNGYRYKADQQVFYRAIQKYGWDNFEHIIWADKLTEDEAKHCEQILISLFKTNCVKYRNPDFGYNMTDGGDGKLGFVFSEESKRKMSASQKHRFEDPENHPMYGVHRFGQDNPNYGNHKLSGSNNPNYDNCRHVIQLTLDNMFVKEYRNAKEAENATGVRATQIYAVCTHKPHYNTAGGFKWLYKDDED